MRRYLLALPLLLAVFAFAACGDDSSSESEATSAPTQEAAAERLSLPFSTYRRHLNRGLDELCGLLWKAENHGLRLLTRAGPLH